MWSHFSVWYSMPVPVCDCACCGNTSKRLLPYPVGLQVMDYLNLKGREYDLSREVANWQRKLEIAEMASRRPVAEDE